MYPQACGFATSLPPGPGRGPFVTLGARAGLGAARRAAR